MFLKECSTEHLFFILCLFYFIISFLFMYLSLLISSLSIIVNPLVNRMTSGEPKAVIGSSEEAQENCDSMIKVAFPFWKIGFRVLIHKCWND
jgi:hypothetical protein